MSGVEGEAAAVELGSKGLAWGSEATDAEVTEEEGCSRSIIGEGDVSGTGTGRADEERVGTKLFEMLRVFGEGMMRCEERRCIAACCTSSAGVSAGFEVGCDASGVKEPTADGRTPTEEERLKPGLDVPPLSSARLCRLEDERLKPRPS